LEKEKNDLGLKMGGRREIRQTEKGGRGESENAQGRHPAPGGAKRKRTALSRNRRDKSPPPRKVWSEEVLWMSRGRRGGGLCLEGSIRWKGRGRGGVVSKKEEKSKTEFKKLWRRVQNKRSGSTKKSQREKDNDVERKRKGRTRGRSSEGLPSTRF